jgi:hypothetical protein
VAVADELEQGDRPMNPDDADAALVARLAPRLCALHEANGGDWAGTVRDALALLRQPPRVDPHDGTPRDGSGAEQDGTDTLDAPREDD